MNFTNKYNIQVFEDFLQLYSQKIDTFWPELKGVIIDVYDKDSAQLKDYIINHDKFEDLSGNIDSLFQCYPNYEYNNQTYNDIIMREDLCQKANLSQQEQVGDFLIGESPDASGFYNAAGIESPGLSSAPAIGALLANQVAEKLSLRKKKHFQAKRKGILKPDTLSMEERNALIRENPAYGNIICRCEMITEGEILDAIHRPLGARSLDAVKRRTRAGMGRCQSGFCSPRTMEILEREVPLSMYDITKNGGKSVFVVGRNKEGL